MEPMTLITSAITLATPYLIKTGEKIAERIGEDIWTLIKSPFTTKKKLSINITNQEEKEKLIVLLLEEIKNNQSFKQELELAVSKSQEELKAYKQQNINNNGQINKQINIQINSGNIQM